MEPFIRAVDNAQVVAVQYTGTAKSVHKIIDMIGCQIGITNTEIGLMVAGSLYRRGTWFVKSEKSIVPVVAKAFEVDYYKE